jgi:hypothetical protein
MSEEYLIITLTEETFAKSESFQSGAEQKYKIPWAQVDPSREQLAIFKIDNEPSAVSRVWIEKLAAELAISMGLPTATYEMCQTEDNRRGIASPSYLKDGGVEQPGIALMQEVFETNSVLYTVKNALNVFDCLDISLPSGYMPPPEVSTAKDLFIGYLLHSYWVDDPDFHARNWGIQINPNGERELLPNYDYGRALVDFPIVNNRLEIFAERLAGTRTCAFVNNDGKEIKMDEMVEILKQISPNTTKYWSDRIAQASTERLNPICDLFPSGWGSPERIEFARVFINYNSQRLAQLTEAPFQLVSEVENSTTIDHPNPDDSPEPPNDSPEPPNPRTPPNSPKPSTPPNSPDSTTSPDPPNSADSSQSLARSTEIENPGITTPNIDSQQLTDLHQQKQIMTDLEGFHSNAQNQVSANAGDISKLAEQLGQALGLIGGESSAKAVKETAKAIKELVKAFRKIKAAQKKEQAQSETQLNNSIIAKSLADRKAGLQESKQRLTDETRELRRDSRKHAIKVGLDYIVSLLANVKKFLKDVWDAPGNFFRNIKNKFTSLKDFMSQETKGAVKIGQELTGNKQEQAEKFIKLLNTPTGEQAPQGLEDTIIAPWGENLIVVDAENNVTANLIQPLMSNELIQLAMDKNVVAAAMAPNIKPVPNSLASHEFSLHERLIGQDAIDQLLANVQATQLSKSTVQELENLISEPAQIKLEAIPEAIEQQSIPVSVEKVEKTEIPAVVVDLDELIPDPFDQPTTQPIVITKAQLEDLSDDRFDDLKAVVFADLDKNDAFGSRLEKMQAAADRFITNDEYAALEQFETTNLQALFQKLEANITAEEVNIPEFSQHLAENPNSLPQDQETDLKSIQIRTEKLADAKALLTFIEAKYLAQQAADTLEQPKYQLIDINLSELTVERNAEIERAIIPHNSALTAEARQENLDRVLADPKYAEIQSSAAETVMITIQDNTERLEHNRAENLARITRKNTELTGVQQLVNHGEVEDPNRQDRVGELTKTVDKLTQFDEYHHQELATLAQLTASIQRPNLKPVAVELPEPTQVSQLPKSPTLVATAASKPKLNNLQPSPQTDFVAIVVTPKLASELVTISQLHQIGTSSDNSSLPLLKGNEGRDSLSIAHTAQANGLHSYQVVDAGKEFNFTVTSEQIVTNFNIGRNNDLSQVRNLVTSIANVVKNPEQTEIKPHPDTDIQRIETVQKLNDLLDRTSAAPDLPAKSVVTLDSEKFGVRLDRDNRTMTIIDKTTLATMTLSKNGVEDGGLLKKMTDVAKDKSSSLAQRLARVVVEKANAAKTAMENAAPNIMVALDERATADRATAQKMSKAVNRLGSQVDGFIEQGIRNVAAANPGMLGSIRKMKKIEQVGDATENQVKDNLQSTGEHLGDTPPSNAPVSDAPLTENRGLLTADEREQLQREFNAVVVHKPKAQASSPAVQQSL